VTGDQLAEGYRLSEDPALLDMRRVFQWLSGESYWAFGRERGVVERSFAGAFPVGIYLADHQVGAGRQVAVARIVSDGATFAWLCDVFVDAGHRGKGLGTRLSTWAVDWICERGVPRILLTTRDAHAVYASAGFGPVRNPSRWMEIDERPQRGPADPT
jgi:GNAT superfamily N-acetyltransferase